MWEKLQFVIIVSMVQGAFPELWSENSPFVLILDKIYTTTTKRTVYHVEKTFHFVIIVELIKVVFLNYIISNLVLS